MARYSGGKCCCTCGDFDTEGKGIATERLFTEKTSGTGQYQKTYYVLAGKKERECDPEACPWATGDHDIVKYKGTALCKPQVVLSAGLPWFPVVGTVAKFKTTGWHSYRALRDSLLTIAMQSVDVFTNEDPIPWLHDLPNLWLVLDWELAGNGQLVPSVRVEYRGQVGQLRAKVIDVQGKWLKQGEVIKQLQSGIVQAVEEDEEKPEEQESHQAEFAHPGYDVRPPIIDGDVEDAAPEEPEQPEDLGEELVLQPPPDPPKPDAITDLPAMNAAMKQLGITTKAKAESLKGEVGLDGISNQDLTVANMQALYSHALSGWRAANAEGAAA